MKMKKVARKRVKIARKNSTVSRINLLTVVLGILVVLLGIVAIIVMVSATDDLLGLQGNVRQSGVNLDTGNVTIYIFDAFTGGNVIYNSTGDFNNSVSSGRYDVLLGNGSRQLSLQYGQLYYMEMYVNGEKFDFNGNGRQEFQSSIGQINSSAVDNFVINSTHLERSINLSNATAIPGGEFSYNQTDLNTTWAYNSTLGTFNIYGENWSNHTLIYNNTYGQIIYNHTREFNNSMGVLIYNHTREYNVTMGLLIYNHTREFNNSMGIVLYNHTTTSNSSITTAYGEFFYNQSIPYDAFNYNQTLGAITSVTGTIDFNGGWQSNGLTIQNGDLYAQTVFVYNISSLGVNNLEVNGSMVPNPGFNNTFDVGNSSSQWRNGWFGTDVFINGVSLAQFSYNQTTAFNNSMGIVLYNHTTAYNNTYGPIIYNHTREYNVTMGLLIYNHTREFNNSMGIVLYNHTTTSNSSITTAYGEFFYNQTGNWTTNGTAISTVSGISQVGIGTATPTTTLDVSGQINSTDRIMIHGDSPDIWFVEDAVESWIVQVNANDLEFWGNAGTTEYVTFQDGGNVGIGTSGPDDLLHVNTSAIGAGLNTSLIRIQNPNTVANARTGIGFAVNTHSGANWDGAMILGVNDGVTTGDLAFGSVLNSAFTEYVRFDSSSKSVGIGTSTPTEELVVSGDALITSTGTTRLYLNDSNGGSVVEINAITDRTSADQGLLSIEGWWNANEVAAIRFKTGDDTTNEDDGDIVFDVSQGGTLAEAMRIDQSGNVGIGASAPEATLHILSGDSGAAPQTWADDLFIEGTGAAGITIHTDTLSDDTALYFGNAAGGTTNEAGLLYRHDGDSNTGLLSLISGGAERVYIEGSGGFVGILTSTPDDALDVIGNIDLSGELEVDDIAAPSGTLDFSADLVNNIDGLRIGDTGTPTANDLYVTQDVIIGNNLDVTGIINADATGSAISSDGDIVFTGINDVLDFSEDVADKIYLYDTTYGIGISSSELNTWLPTAADFSWRTVSRTGSEIMELDGGTGDLTITGDLAVNGDTITADGDLTLNPAGGEVFFANLDTINIGGLTTATAYNYIADALTAVGHVNSDDDLYIEGVLEVQGGAWLSTGTTWSEGDIAEALNTEASRDNGICNGDVNCYLNNTLDDIDYGDLVCIDSTQSYTIMKCNEANTQLAIGFISDTAVLNVGADTGYPVSLAGIVNGFVTNENGDVFPGDLLVSSSRAGYAMKNNNPQDGTVVGKAFDFCEEEDCRIKVFVALS
jgi:ethanolamine utilization microcompartment shell protein EutS